MKPPGDQFISAYRDYLYLLERTYPAKTILNLVTTRYSLSATERAMLFRGVATSVASGRRSEKKISLMQGSNSGPVHIDTLNVLLTLHAYLTGLPVFISTDGFLRDAAEVHGSSDLPHLERCIVLLVSYLEGTGFSEFLFYFDEKADNTAPSKQLLETSLKKSPQPARVIVSDATDRLIESAVEGVAATSDSTIIDRADIPVADLPEEILRRNFQPSLLNLKDIS